MNTLHYDIKGRFNESERRRKLFSIVISEEDQIINFASAPNTVCNLCELQEVLHYLNISKFSLLMQGKIERNEEPLKDFHIGGNYRMVLSKKQPKQS